MNLQKREISYYLKLMACLLILTVVHLFIDRTESLAGEQAEQAIAAVKELVKTGEIAKGATIKLLVKQGNINNFWGNNFEIKNEWEERTGILIDARIMPQRALLEYVKENKDIDIMVARQREYPDLYTGNYITELTPLLKKYKFVLDDNPVNGYISPKVQAEFDNKVVAIPADGDITVLYLRKDLMDDSVHKEKFKKKYNSELTIPETLTLPPLSLPPWISIGG